MGVLVNELLLKKKFKQTTTTTKLLPSILVSEKTKCP